MRRFPSGARWSLLALVVATGCEVSSHGPRDREKVRGTTEMMAAGEADSIAGMVREAVMATFGTGPQAASGMPALYTQDAVLSDVTEQTHSGNAAIARWFAQGMPPGASISIRSTGATGSGDLVVDMGTYTFSAPDPRGGPPMEMRGRYMIAIQQMSDGSWKIVRQIDDAMGIGGAVSAGPPPSGPPANGAATTDSAGSNAGAPRPVDSGFTDRDP